MFTDHGTNVSIEEVKNSSGNTVERRTKSSNRGEQGRCVQVLREECGEEVKTGQPLKNTSGQGRKLLSTERDDRRLLQLYKADRTKSSRQLSSEFVLSSGKVLSARTISSTAIRCCIQKVPCQTQTSSKCPIVEL